MEHTGFMNGPDEETADAPSDAVGWGDERPEDAETATDEWYLAERPPHHGT
jgi:hypothetical protein